MSWLFRLPKFLAQFKSCQYLSDVDISCDFSQDALLELPGTPSWLNLTKLWSEVDQGHSPMAQRKLAFYLPERQGRQNVISQADIVTLIKERLPQLDASNALYFGRIEGGPCQVIFAFFV